MEIIWRVSALNDLEAIRTGADLTIPPAILARADEVIE